MATNSQDQALKNVNAAFSVATFFIKCMIFARVAIFLGLIAICAYAVNQ